MINIPDILFNSYKASVETIKIIEKRDPRYVESWLNRSKLMSHFFEASVQLHITAIQSETMQSFKPQKNDVQPYTCDTSSRGADESSH
jgi:hypothetical protein